MRFPHWQFFESLDEELHSLSRIIEFSKDNFPTYSVHVARLYLSVCSEIDVVAKMVCTQADSSKKYENIDDYRSLIVRKYSHFPALKIELPGHELDFQPWATWASNVNPQWWRSYNNVKHERNKFFKSANLGNLLESSAGLLVLLVYLHQPDLYSGKGHVQPNFKVMCIESRYAGCMRFGFSYSLPDFGKSSA